MEKVFISYGHADLSVAEQLCIFLEQSGLTCWIAPRDISTGNYAGEITRALRTSDIIVVICSKESCLSEHVKNEVTLAFNNKKQILPYCLEDNAFDDDLEYFLSSKQRIQASNNTRKDFANIEKLIREYRHQNSHKTAEGPDVPPQRRNVLWVVLSSVMLVVFILASSVLYNRSKIINKEKPLSTIIEPTVDNEEAIDLKLEPETPTQIIPKAKKDSQANTFSGTISGGLPNGYGILRFRSTRRIDLHDPEERIAQPGDYIEGNWEYGHLNYGKWHKADGSEAVFIQLGDYPNKEVDKELGACVKP